MRSRLGTALRSAIPVACATYSSFWPNCSSVAFCLPRASQPGRSKALIRVTYAAGSAGCFPSRYHSQNESVGVISTAYGGRGVDRQQQRAFHRAEVVANVRDAFLVDTETRVRQSSARRSEMT